MKNTYKFKKDVPFQEWMKDIMDVWGKYLMEDFDKIGIDPYALTEENFYETLKPFGELYNRDWNLYRIGKYTSVRNYKSSRGETLQQFNFGRELSNFGHWSNGEYLGSSVYENPNPNIDTSREGT